MRALTATAVLLVLGSGAAWAQRPQVRDGFWIGFGFGYGSAALSCDGCTGAGRESGSTAFIRLGGAPSKQVLLGCDINVWVQEEGTVQTGVGNLSFAVYYYPQPASGLFVRGGVGTSVALVRDIGTESEANGYGFIVGGGYDIRVGRNLSLTPVVNFYLGADGDLKEGAAIVSSGYKHNVLELGLGITFH